MSVTPTLRQKKFPDAGHSLSLFPPVSRLFFFSPSMWGDLRLQRIIKWHQREFRQPFAAVNAEGNDAKLKSRNNVQLPF